ncbi:hypothetical protein BGZ63DRAFT_425413 [Mariannaea sp. PMI_226]|nr:hypothetical protein BGZ63DRAFT_425413 [Mariannaea sp. PMI_226]
MALHRQKRQVIPDNNLENGVHDAQSRLQDSSPVSHDQYTIAWICALPIEMAAACAVLDHIHRDLPRSTNDTNTYTLGTVQRHNVVVACLPTAQYGTNNAANVLTHLIRTFPSIRFGLMVGIGGGVPSKVDMRLGDVVVGTRVTQYDLGKIIGDGQIQRTAIPKSPHHLLGTAVASLQARHERGGSRIPLILGEMFDGHPQYRRPTATDLLFSSEYNHTSPASNCDECDRSNLVTRRRRSTDDPVIHYGVIASGNQVMRNGTQRDNIAWQLDAICFEMEAAGLMDILPCLPIRGICDYSDSHKNKGWQRYAAATAAAYARELLGVLPVAEVQTKAAPAPNPTSFQVPFSLQGAPVSDKFIDRPTDRTALEQCLLPQQCSMDRRKVCVLHGLGGIGKTQLAIDFARRHKAAFSAIFWLDGRSEDQLRQSFARCLTRIPELRAASRNPDMNLNSHEGLDVAVMKVMEWLAQPSNTQWLLIFDNVDQDHQQGGTTGAYDIRQYFPGDQGSILITTRLLRLQQLDWCPDYDTLLDLLQGLPLALAQAASYLRETGVDIETYIKIYNKQWQKVMGSDNPLTDYHQGSIATTWAVSLNAIENETLAWPTQSSKYTDPEKQWPPWLFRMASDVTCFVDAMGLLLRYSMIQVQAEPRGTYAMHPVVHRWVLHLDNSEKKREFARMALILVGHSVPTRDTKGCWTLQQRILPHAERCLWWIQENFSQPDNEAITDSLVTDSIHGLGMLYWNQGKPSQAEAMYGRALEGSEKALGRDHISTLRTVNNLALVYLDQGKFSEAEVMLVRAIKGKEKALGYNHISTLGTIKNLGSMYWDQGKIDEAEVIIARALKGMEEALGYNHVSTLNAVNNLGLVYKDQGKLDKAQVMLERALVGTEKALGRNHSSTLNTVYNLGIVYGAQGRISEAEAMYDRALKGREETLGRDHTATLDSLYIMGRINKDKGKLREAEVMFDQALEGFQSVLGPNHFKTQAVAHDLQLLRSNRGEGPTKLMNLFALQVG